ncbi:MAG: Gfo/Idh/MocA family oxidoreductase [Clostridia bacterium]|jgi:predicted dehydrogenase|nr:Gfo/Idh/MocA family oxidoreductase [Clostridia bacterium]
MKVCFYGNTGHFFTAFLVRDMFPDLEFTGYCKSFPEEDMGQLKLFAGKAKGTYPDGWEIHARNSGSNSACDPVEYNTLEEMLDIEKPDILVVDGRFTERYEAEKAALIRGINVYADKPIAVKVDELLDLYECVKKSGKILWAMDTVRYDPWYYTAKLLIEEGEIGKVRMVNCQKSYRLGTRLSFYKERKYYGGTIPWVTIHPIDMIRMVTGKEILSVYSQQSRADNCGYGQMEIITTSCFELEDDILATVSTDYYRPENTHSHDDDRMRVVGTKGILEVARREGDHEVRLINSKNNGFVPIPQKKPPFIFEDFVNTLKGKGAGLLNVEESFRNAYVAICAQQSADEKKIIYMENAKKLFP